MYDRETALIIAAKRNFPEIIDLILDIDGIDIRAREDMGYSALDEAIQRENPDTIFPIMRRYKNLESIYDSPLAVNEISKLNLNNLIRIMSDTREKENKLKNLKLSDDITRVYDRFKKNFPHNLEIADNNLTRVVAFFIDKLGVKNQFPLDSFDEFLYFLNKRIAQEDLDLELNFLNSKLVEKKLLQNRKLSTSQQLQYGFARFVEKLVLIECALRVKMFIGSAWNTFPQTEFLRTPWDFWKVEPQQLKNAIERSYNIRSRQLMTLYYSKKVARYIKERLDSIGLANYNLDDSHTEKVLWKYNFHIDPVYASKSISFIAKIAPDRLVIVDKESKLEILDEGGKSLQKIDLCLPSENSFETIYRIVDSLGHELLIGKYATQLIIINIAEKVSTNIGVQLDQKAWKLRQSKDEKSLVIEFIAKEETQFGTFSFDWQMVMKKWCTYPGEWKPYLQPESSLKRIRIYNSSLLMQDMDDQNKNRSINIDQFNGEHIPDELLGRDLISVEENSNEKYLHFDIECAEFLEDNAIVAHKNAKVSFWYK